MLASIVDNWNESLNAAIASLGYSVEDMVRLALAALFGGLVGLERELRGRQAGFRTHILVCVGCALVMVVSTAFATHQWNASPGNGPNVVVQVDPARIAYGVMTGVGFLGAGAIVHSQGGLIRGLTTAAAIWCVSAIGLAVGFGMYLQSLAATIIVLAVLWILDYVEGLLPRVRHRSITIRRKYERGCIDRTLEFVKSAGTGVVQHDFRRTDDMQFADVEVLIWYRRKADYRKLERRLDEESEYQLIGSREI